MKLLIIYNPKAGNGRAKKLLPQIQHYLEEKGLNTELKLTEYPSHAAELTRDATLKNYDAIIASGGDGTLFEVINGYYQNQAQDKPPIGLIPNGTGNAFMKELNMQKADWRRAIDIIIKAYVRQLDVGRLISEGRQYYFVNMVGMGFVTQVAKAAIPLKWLGNAAYTLATLKKLIRLKPQRLILHVDGERLERQGVFVEVANSSFTGTRFLMAPQAKLDDGLLDVVILKQISRLRLLKLFTSIYDGSHLQYPEIEYIQAKKISVIEEKPESLIPDGEVLGKSPAEFECLPRHLKFLWDAIDIE